MRHINRNAKQISRVRALQWKQPVQKTSGQDQLTMAYNISIWYVMEIQNPTMWFETFTAFVMTVKSMRK